jgi:hypothetical protein
MHQFCCDGNCKLLHVRGAVSVGRDAGRFALGNGLRPVARDILMGIETNAVPEKLPGGLRIVLGLLVFSVFINYVDRGSLSIAAPMISRSGVSLRRRESPQSVDGAGRHRCLLRAASPIVLSAYGAAPPQRF